MVWEFLAVAARAAVQWVLASLLLANGAAFCVIAAVSERLRLGPPCILCARVHRLLCSTASAGEGRDALRLLLCDAHLAAVAATGAEHEARGVMDSRSKESKEELDVGDRDKLSGLESRRVVSIGSEICEQDHDTNGSDAGRANHTNDDSPLVSLFELTPIVAQPRKNDSEQSLHKVTPPEQLLHNVEGGERLTVGQLLSLRAQRREMDALRAELEEERRARAAAEELQRQVEEQGELDREAARLAMELVHETEREKLALLQQLDSCRAYKAQLCGGGQRAGEEEERGGGEGDNNYQSLVDFLPGSVYSSTPDLVNLLNLYTEPSGSNGERWRRESYAPAVTVVDEEVEEEEMAVAVTATGTESGVDDDASAATAGRSLHQENTTSCQVQNLTESA